MDGENEGKQPAVFLDRDGVLNRYLPGDYVKRVEELEVLPGVGAAIANLNRAGFPVFLISNQQGVAKGLMTQSDLDEIDAALKTHIMEAGGQITQSYYCPHEAGQCECRKPLPGLILQAATDHNIDLPRSVFIGDTETDAQAARAAGVGQFILVLTGKHKGAEAGADVSLFPLAPEYIAANLPNAAAHILSTHPKAAE